MHSVARTKGTRIVPVLTIRLEN